VALPVRRLCVGCKWVRSGRVAAAPPACAWPAGIHWAAGCARGTLCSRWSPTRHRKAVAPPMPRGSATAGTGRCTPPLNPNPRFRAAGQWSGQAVTHRKACRPTREHPPRRRKHSKPAWCHQGSCSARWPMYRPTRNFGISTSSSLHQPKQQPWGKEDKKRLVSTSCSIPTG
jgi:hypothetical protein